MPVGTDPNMEEQDDEETKLPRRPNEIDHVYPRVPMNTDFEAFRITDKNFKRLIKEVKKSGNGHFGEDRLIFVHWPRDPNGKTIALEDLPRAKHTGNGCLTWGSTLYDFYTVNRCPQIPQLVTYTVGSKLAKWMKENGETKHCRYQLEQAEYEQDPRRIEVYDIGKFLRIIEEMAREWKIGKSVKQDEKKDICMFPPSSYPSPWPLKPFSIPAMRLQKRISHSLLPRKLVVHDPWNVLATGDDTEGPIGKWGSRRDVIRHYKLNLNPVMEGEKRPKGNTTSEEEDCQSSTPVAHLYITPKRCIGRGHHSLVFQAELELPRDLLVTSVHDEENIYPPSHRVSVTAKLSFPNDKVDAHANQLVNEARAYTSFKDHIFEHWSGYNLLAPLGAPVPIGAVAPQFYGFYEPEKGGKSFKRGRRLSNILLLEHCGQQIDPTALTKDEKYDCLGLLARLHLSGWAHLSFYARNIVIQNGPLQASPFERSREYPRFRLIDYGRSAGGIHTGKLRPYKYWEEKKALEALKLDGMTIPADLPR